MNPRGIALALCASLGAVLVALATWKAAGMLVDVLGLAPLRPLVLVAALFLSLTVLQAAWDKVEHLVRSSSGSGPH